MSRARASLRRWSARRRAACGALLAMLFLVGLSASHFVVARAAPAAEISLRLWPSGQGRIEVTQGGQGLDPDPCSFESVLSRGAAVACTVTVTAGSPVTLTAVPEPGATVPAGHEEEVPDFPVASPTFVRWSLADCGTATQCTFTPTADSDGDWITALFSPLQLQVGVVGVGDVTFHRSDGVDVTPQCPTAVGFGDKTCHAAVPADLDVRIAATPAPTGWGIGCEPDTGAPTSPTCTVTMSNLRTLVSVSFDGSDPLDPPFRLTPTVKVALTGPGSGQVTGSGIDCPGTCQISPDYQARIHLRAEARSGSRFVRWVGVCSTDPACVFAAGSATQVQARFDTATTTTATTNTTTSSGTTTTRTSTTTSTTSVSTSTSSTTTTTSTTGRVARLQLRRVALSGHGSRRVVAFTIVVDRAGRASARLVSRRGTVASRGYRLGKGTNLRRLPVPRRVKAGAYRLSIRVVTAGVALTVGRTVRIPR